MKLAAPPWLGYLEPALLIQRETNEQYNFEFAAGRVAV